MGDESQDLRGGYGRDTFQIKGGGDFDFNHVLPYGRNLKLWTIPSNTPVILALSNSLIP